MAGSADLTSAAWTNEIRVGSTKAGEFIGEMAGVGNGRLSVSDLVLLRQNGVTADFVEQAREAGYGTSDVSDLIRLTREGIPGR